MRLVICVVLSGLLGACAFDDYGHQPGYGYGHPHGRLYQPVYHDGYRQHGDVYRVEQRVIQVPVYPHYQSRHYEPHRQPSYRPPSAPVHRPQVTRGERRDGPKLAPGYRREPDQRPPRDNRWQGRERGHDRQQHAPRQHGRDSGRRR